VLYAGTWNASEKLEVWSYNGIDWTQEASGGLGNPGNSNVWSMAVYEGDLYIGTENSSTGSEVWRMSDEESSGETGGCFIATAAFGSKNAHEVIALRNFRDSYLNTSEAGRIFIRAYYRISPPLASFIKERPMLRGAAALALIPLVLLIENPYAACFFASLALLPTLGILRRRERRRWLKRQLLSWRNRSPRS
jgi:hypothetical protein